MGYTTDRIKYPLSDLAFPATPGEGPFVSEGDVSQGGGYCALKASTGVAANVWQNDLGPAKAQDYLRAMFAIRRDVAATAGVKLGVGLVGTKGATIVESKPRAFVSIDGDDELKVEIDDGVNSTGLIPTGINLDDKWRQVEIDLYTGIQSVSPPGRSVGGLGNVLFSIADDAGQLKPVARGTLFDLSSIGDTFLQLMFSAANSSGDNELHVKIADIEVRRLPAN